MALTYSILSKTQSRNKYQNIVQITCDTSYPTGGYALSANSCGMGTIEGVIVCNGTVGANLASYDATNKKVLLTVMSTGAQLANATNVSTVVLNLLVQGQG